MLCTNEVVIALDEGSHLSVRVRGLLVGNRVCSLRLQKMKSFLSLPTQPFANVADSGEDKVPAGQFDYELEDVRVSLADLHSKQSYFILKKKGQEVCFNIFQFRL